MKLASVAQAVLIALLIAVITGGVALWADLRALPSEVRELRKAIEAHTVALAVLEERSKREAKDHGRAYVKVED